MQQINIFQRSVPYGLVAKDVPRKLCPNMRKAFEAIEVEWVRLPSQTGWDEARPRTLGSVKANAKRDNETIHLGRLFDMLVENGNELP